MRDEPLVDRDDDAYQLAAVGDGQCLTGAGGLPDHRPGQFADPDNFVPWYVGLIEIPGLLRVESLLVDCGADDLEFGRPMRLVIVPFRRVEPDVEVVTFAFAPDSPTATTDPEARHA